MRKLTVLFIMLLLGIHMMYAQQLSIKGTVTDKRLNDPIIGASVLVEGTSNGTITDMDGNFSLKNVSKGNVLVVSYIGYQPQRLTIDDNQTTFRIMLTEDTQTLDEVVVVGFGTQKKVNLTGAVATVDTKTLESRPVTSVSQALQGVMPGLNIDINDVWIYGTNIYKLYEDIVREYGNDWAKDRIDVDLPFVISKKEHMETVYYRNDFTNIILVFDYERHDPAFSEEKILEMQHCFEDSTDMGKLYVNYPMIESYLHLKSMPDGEYINRKIPVSLQPGDRYKCLVKSESVLGKFIELPHRIDKLSNTPGICN